MKRILIAIACLCALVSGPQAQAQRLKEAHPNEISTSFGVSLLGVSVRAVTALGNKLGDLAGLWDQSGDDKVRVRIGGTGGITTLGYSYTINKAWQFGASVGFDHLSVHVSDNTGTFRPLTANLFSIMHTAQVNWFRTDNDLFGMYSKFGAGVWIVNYGLMVDTADEKRGTKTFYPIGQVSAVCLEIGRQFSGFLELGFGMQGSVITGIRARF